MSGFRTKLDFSNNRQVKQRIETTTVLSGGTSFGVTFNQLPTGPNYPLSSITQTLTTTTASTATFSGNNTTTVYTWPDVNMYLADSTLSAWTPSNSAVTQTTDYVFTADTSSLFTVDGNSGYGSYTGIGYTVFVTSFTDLGSSAYTGTVQYTNVEMVEAPGLDYSGRTIWNDVSGITRTEKLIITSNPSIGNVWTCLDSEGMGGWLPISGSSGTTTDYWISGSTGLKSLKTNNSSGIDSTGDYSLAEGFGGLVYGYAGHVGGYNSISSGITSFVHSYSSTTEGDFSTILGGSGNTITTGPSGSTYNMNLFC